MFSLCLLPLLRAPRVSVVFVVVAVEVGQKGGVNRLHLETENLTWEKMLITKRDLKMVILRVEKKIST